MSNVMRALGLMSGTSLDGIDAAMIVSDGEKIISRGETVTYPYPAGMRARLRAGLEDAKAIEERHERPGSLAALEEEITHLHAEAVAAYMRQQGLSRRDLDAVGFHGQTVLHRPPQVRIETGPDGVPFEVGEPGLTVQLGNGVALSDLTGLTVVHDMRAADVEAGGHGAPLVPVYHRALAASLPQKPVAFINIGGVANVTVVEEDGGLIAFDTGPGNALIDDWVGRCNGGTHDTNGALAAQGKVCATTLRSYLSDPYFAALPPKSLDRNGFSLDGASKLAAADGAATLTALTAAAIAKAREHMHREPELWIVCGGGRRNPVLMANLAERVENAVVPAEAAGFSGDGMEAEAWAFLAIRSLLRLPLSYPTTTGVPEPLTGGVVTRAPAGAV